MEEFVKPVILGILLVPQQQMLALISMIDNWYKAIERTWSEELEEVQEYNILTLPNVACIFMSYNAANVKIFIYRIYSFERRRRLSAALE